jgi:predicted nucleic acid-binding protein
MARAARFLIKGGETAISAGSKCFFDTNVWLLVHGPYADPNDQRTREYSKFLKNILENEGVIYIDQLVVAEFINAYIRIRYRVLLATGEAPQEYKRFRRSSAYRAILKDASDDIYHLAAICAKTGGCFVDLDVVACVDECVNADVDFNDLIFGKICEREGFILVTDDADCDFPNVAIATANRRFPNVSGRRRP